MNKIILTFLLIFISTISKAEYILKFPLENLKGGAPPDGSIVIKNNTPQPIPENLDLTKITVGSFSAPNGKTYIGYSSGVETTHGNFGSLIRAGIKNINGFYVNRDNSGYCELNITGTTNVVNSISNILISGKTYSSSYIWQQPLNGSYLNRRNVNCSLVDDLQALVNQTILIEFP